ncbi:MAG: hypothetical protein WBH68_03100 [Erysipelotrichaceae bacterium]|jgi:glycosyltransferase involved in cell wall biosynthesis
MTKKILVIPGGFVPYNDTVTLLSYKHLRSLDAEMDVIALKGKEDEGLAQSLKEDENFKKFNIEYFGYYDDTVATYERKNVVSCFFNFIKYCFYAKNKAKEKKYDVVYTSSIPSFTHLSGYLIKKMLKDDIVWIASFSDPLYKSPYKKDLESFKEYNIIQKIGFFVYIWIYMNGMYEKIAQKYADKVLYICKEQKEFMVSHYPNKEELNKKAMVIPLNYIKDWSIYKDLLIKNKTKNKKKIISHFGRIYGLRKIDLVLHAIKELKEEIPNLSEKLVFEQYGQILDRYVNMIEELNIGDIFKCFDKISYKDVMDKMHKSDALALYDTFVKEDEMQPYLPSKSLEYLLLKKDLLILAQKNSPTYRIFISYGYKCTDNDVNSIKERIKEILYSDNGYMDYDISSLENEVATKPLQEYISKIRKERL